MRRAEFASQMVLLAVVGAMACLLPPLAHAQDVWTLTSADFSSQRVTLLALDDQAVRVRTVNGETVALRWDRLLELERGAASTRVLRAPPGSFLAILRDGDRFVGNPRALQDESVLFSTALGDFRLPLRELSAIARSLDHPPDRDTPTVDQVLLGNGDRISGVIDSIDGAVLHVGVNGEITPVPWETVSAVRFAGTGDNPIADAAARRAFRVSLVGGTRATTESLSIDGDAVVLRDGTVERRAPLRTVLSIEQVNGPVRWLTSMAPVEALHQPYFAQISLPPRFDAPVTGAGPILLPDGDRPARSGVGMASYSRVVWALPEGFVAFRCAVAIDGAGALANVTARVLLDDRVAFEQVDLTGNSGAPPVLIPLNGAKRLTLEVDYGKALDVQDRVNWIEPALLREMPTTQPAG